MPFYPLLSAHSFARCCLKHQGLEEYVRIKYAGNNRNMSVEKENEILKWFDDKANAGQIITVKEIKAAFDKKLGEGYRTRLYLYAVSSARMDKEEASSGTSEEGK